MRESTQEKKSSRDYYGLKLFLSLSLLLTLLTFTSFYLIQHYYSKNFLSMNFSGDTIYFLKSHTVESRYEKNKLRYKEYTKRIKAFEQYAQESNYDTEEIYVKDLITIPKNAIVIALDMVSLTNYEIAQINNFVNNGGAFLFNFKAGFLDKSNNYQIKNLVTTITPLIPDPQIDSLAYKKRAVGYLSLRMNSIITKYLSEGKAEELTIYDPLPIFQTPKTLQADAYLTNWVQTNYIQNQNNQELTQKQSGLVWHGYTGKGKWVYFSFPSSAFLERNQNDFKNLFRGMLNFLNNEIVINTYPYIDAKNAVFVSKDTEYKFKDIVHFYNSARKYNFPVTAFCVAKIAEKYPKIMKKFAENPLFEIGSHSYSHQQIIGKSDAVYTKELEKSKNVLEDLTDKKVIGFRAPREEIDKKMIQYLEKEGYHYIFFKGENILMPYFYNSILIIPRHATDDYAYFINLDWNAKKILNSMKHQANVVTNLNGIYTLSTHSHLMSYGSNIKMLEQFFAYVHKNKKMTPMNGAMIYQRIKLKSNLSFTTKQTEKNIILTISNNNPKAIKNLYFEVTHNPNIKILSVESEIIGTKVELLKEKNTLNTIHIDYIKPKSQLVIFISYAEKN